MQRRASENDLATVRAALGASDAPRLATALGIAWRPLAAVTGMSRGLMTCVKLASLLV